MAEEQEGSDLCGASHCEGASAMEEEESEVASQSNVDPCSGDDSSLSNGAIPEEIGEESGKNLILDVNGTSAMAEEQDSEVSSLDPCSGDDSSLSRQSNGAIPEETGEENTKNLILDASAMAESHSDEENREKLLTLDINDMPEEEESGTSLSEGASQSNGGPCKIPQVAGDGNRKKLLILDINGLLVDVFFDADGLKPSRQHDDKIGRFYMYRRPHCEEFVRFCLEHFRVAIWSSAKWHNVTDRVKYVFGKSVNELVFCWSQEQCTDTGKKHIENKYKPLFLKELSKVWESSRPTVPWKKGEYGPWNTLLIDDSPYKVLRNPEHTAILPEPYSAMNESGADVLPTLQAYLEKLLLHPDTRDYVRDNPIGQPMITEEDFNLKVAADSKTKKQAVNVEKEGPNTDKHAENRDNEGPDTDRLRRRERKRSKRDAWVSVETGEVVEYDRHQRYREQYAGESVYYDMYGAPHVYGATIPVYGTMQYYDPRIYDPRYSAWYHHHGYHR